ncbi:MAG: hypothetical protein JSS57_04470 [Proteobacteria bacterium]|nr:hypothetical protein [Pseudomonadota bacterium]
MTAKTPNQRRQEAGYSTGAKKDRCSTCAMCSSSHLKHMATRSDRHCIEIDAPVSASGTCDLYLPGRNNDMPELPDMEARAA